VVRSLSGVLFPHYREQVLAMSESVFFGELAFEPPHEAVGPRPSVCDGPDATGPCLPPEPSPCSLRAVVRRTARALMMPKPNSTFYSQWIAANG
jgi:hypothetical protein